MSFTAYCYLLLCGVLIPPAITKLVLDANGYIVFCPCMGRFGNQADQLLGSLAFAKNLNRTMVLPHWVEYQSYVAGSHRVKFDDWFKVGPLEEFHRVILMNDFMEEVAPLIWPPQDRISFCYMARRGPINDDCNAKDGNPFGPYWDQFDVDFVKSEFFGDTLTFHVDGRPDLADAWREKYPPDRYPVLAFVSQPAGFPVEKQHVHLHQYLHWSESIEHRALDFIDKNVGTTPFVGVHLRNNLDWPRVCDILKESPETTQIFASPQCLGYNNEFGMLTMDLCDPPKEMILSQVQRAVTRIGAKALFVASDYDHMIMEFQRTLGNNVKVVKLSDDNPQLDLCILAKSDLYICNCLSSFSAFAKRERDVVGKPSEFWTFAPSSSRSTGRGKDEL